MATAVRKIFDNRKIYAFPSFPDSYRDRVVQDLWAMCIEVSDFTSNARLMNGLRFLIKFEPNNFISLIEGEFDPYHVHGWGIKCFADFEKGRRVLMPRVKEYFDGKMYL